MHIHQHLKIVQLYNWSVETSVYVDVDYHNIGIGKTYYIEFLEDISKKQNILNMNACIAIPNERSISFHHHMGYVQVAYFHQCGYKLDKWYDMVWMEKCLENIEGNQKHLFLFLSWITILISSIIF